EPWPPLGASRLGELFIFCARFVVGDHKSEAIFVRRSPLFDRFVERGNEFRRARLATKTRTASPGIPIYATLRPDLRNPLQVNSYHDAPQQTRLTHDPCHQAR